MSDEQKNLNLCIMPTATAPNQGTPISTAPIIATSTIPTQTSNIPLILSKDD